MDMQPEAEQTTDSDSIPSPEVRPLQSRLVHIVYVVTLVCTSVSTFGVIGLFLAIPAIVFWGCIFRNALAIACVAGVLAACTGIFFLPADGSPRRESSRRMLCSNNMKQIAIALHNYHDTYESFPPAFIADEHGKPRHSWRVLLLPFLELTDLYEHYEFDEPWDGPNNRELAASMPDVFTCPSAAHLPQHREGSADYLAVIGPSTAWPEVGGRSLSEFGDGTSSTILVLEAPEFSINWMEPRDPSLDEAVRLLSSSDAIAFSLHGPGGYLYANSGGRNVAFAGGGVDFLKHGLAGETWRALFTVNGGEKWSDTDLNARILGKTRRPRIGKFISLAAFLLLLVLPLAWVWLNPAWLIA